ncbi:hypothetical protein [Phenylobacterium sp.]|uniref:hypothetical protein n=1 Tax=Phenylobacterium sp. TaxID=1871053 RepID=UPI002FE0A8F4
MGQLQTFWFLLMQTTFFGVGLLAPLVTALVLLRPDRERVSRLLLLPTIWIAPLGLAGAFVENPDTIKTAGWLGYVALVMLLAFVVTAAWCIGSLRGARAMAAGCALINAPFALLGAFVMGMAASGTWL